MARPLRIGVAGLDTFDPQRGIGRTATTLSSYWREWGHDVTGVPVRSSRLPLLRNFSWGLEQPDGGVDVLLLPDFLGAESLFFEDRSIPTVAVVNDLGSLDSSADRVEGTLLTIPRFRLSLLALRCTQRVVTISEFTRTRLHEWMPALVYRSQAIHCGVDHHVFFPRDRGESRRLLLEHGYVTGPPGFLIIYVGEEYARKNLARVLEALSLLKRDVPLAQLLKVGRAHNPRHREQTLAAMDRLGLMPGCDVIFAEDVSDEMLARLYSAADVFVTMSTYEGFGLPLLEALACGLPAVSSNAGSLPEVGGDAAIYVQPHDSAALAAELLALANAPPARPVRTSTERAAHFGWEQTARRMLQVLQDVANNRGEDRVRSSSLVQDEKPV